MCRTTRLCFGQSGRQWVQKQANDVFVAEARRRGYVSRSAFKIIDIDNRFGLFSRGRTRVVVDIGCSPGGWLQVARERCGEDCALFGVDLLRVSAVVPGAVCLQGDFTDAATVRELLVNMQHLDARGAVDVVMSDMCVNRGTGATDDRQRQMRLGMEALAFATAQLSTGGHFVCKVLGTPTAFEELHAEAQQWFARYAFCKPPSSRRESDEGFIVCLSKLEAPRAHRHDPGGIGLDNWPGFSRRPRR